jgi:hypothetical protein
VESRASPPGHLAAERSRRPSLHEQQTANG